MRKSLVFSSKQVVMWLAALSLIRSLHVMGDDLCRKWVILFSTDSWTDMAASCKFRCTFIEDL